MRRSIRLTTGLCGLSILALVTSASLNGGEKGKTMLKAGDKAPAFEGVDENGKPWKSTDHVGKKIVVVFFFPAALTGG
jgi:thioredoxin-dependent peroxiredoxin